MRPRSTIVGGVLLTIGFTAGWIVSEWVAGSAGVSSVGQTATVVSARAEAVDVPARLSPTNDGAAASPVTPSAVAECGPGVAPATPAAVGRLAARATPPRSSFVDAPVPTTEAAAPLRIDPAPNEPPPEELASRAVESPPSSASPQSADETESLEPATRAQAPGDAPLGASGIDSGLLAHERAEAPQR